MRSLTELQRLDFPDLLPPIEPVWLGDKGPSGHSSHGCSISAQAIMGMGSVGGRGGGPGVPPPGLKAYISPLDDRISITLKGSSIYAAIF